jgi:hypothetical protein
MTYLLSKYLAVISYSSHATHAIVAARSLSLEGNFAFFENIIERRAFPHISAVKTKSLPATFLQRKILSSFV